MTSKDVYQARSSSGFLLCYMMSADCT